MVIMFRFAPHFIVVLGHFFVAVSPWAADYVIHHFASNLLIDDPGQPA